MLAPVIGKVNGQSPPSLARVCEIYGLRCICTMDLMPHFHFPWWVRFHTWPPVSAERYEGILINHGAK